MSGGTSEEQYAGRQPRGHIITKSEDIQRDLSDKDTVRTLSESQQVRLTSTSVVHQIKANAMDTRRTLQRVFYWF